MDENSTPDTLDNNAGGTIDADTLFESTPSDDHSQTDSNESAEPQEAQEAEAPSEDTSTDEETGSESQATSESEEDETTTPASQFDSDLDEWAKTRGKTLETDEDRIQAQNERNQQREFTRERQAAKQAAELQQSIESLLPQEEEETGDFEYEDPLETELKKTQAEMAKMKATFNEERILRQRSEYIVDKKVTDEESKVMGDLLKELVAEGGKPAYEYWTDPKNLKTWHELAQARLARSLGTSDVEEQARSSERERLAKVTNANGPSMSANSVTTQKQKTAEEIRLEILKSDDY